MKRTFGLVLSFWALVSFGDLTGGNSSGGDQTVPVPAFEYACKLQVRAGGQAIAPATFVINKSNASSLMTVGQTTLQINPRWRDIDPDDFSVVGAFMTNVQLRIPGAQATTSFPFGQRRIALTVGVREATLATHGSNATYANLNCTRTK